MFDIGFWELVILFGLGLVILGPERLPRIAVQLGNWAGQARRMARTLSTQIRSELDIDSGRPFTGGIHSAPPKREYQRPGVDDLKTGAAAGADSEARPETSADGDNAPTGDPAGADSTGTRD